MTADDGRTVGPMPILQGPPVRGTEDGTGQPLPAGVDGHPVGSRPHAEPPPGPVNATYAKAAAALHELADRMAGLADHTGLAGENGLYVTLGVMPGHIEAHPDNAGWVDIIGRALLDRPGQPKRRDSGTQHTVHGDVGPISVAVHAPVPDPAAADKDAEIARLRARVAELEQQDAEHPATGPTLTVVSPAFFDGLMSDEPLDGGEPS